MTLAPEEIIDTRVPTPSDLAQLVKVQRQDQKWSQSTLAELSRLTERTIQRVENGKPSSLDTRRALAGAFGYEDLDVFDKPWPFPNIEKLKAFTAELERTTVVVPLTRIVEGRTLRGMFEGTSSYASQEIGECSDTARENFAAIVDYLSDYNDICDAYNNSQKLDVDRDINELLKLISEEGAVVGAGLRHARIRSKSDAPALQPMDWTNIYVVLSGKDNLPSDIRVPKQIKFG